MKAHKCDVCGVLYEHYAVKWNPNTITLSQLSIHDMTAHEVKYELCPKCAAAVCEVIENRKIGGAQHE